MTYITVEAEVDVDVDSIVDRLSPKELRELADEINNSLSGGMADTNKIVQQMFEDWRNKDKKRIDELLPDMFYEMLGRIV